VPSPAPAEEPKKGSEPTKLAAVTPTPDTAPSADALLARAVTLENEGKNAEAARLLRQAARGKGKAAGEAAKRYGDMLQVGKPGVSRDYGEALRYYQIARDNGVEPPAVKERR
jgi:TPR repeat protein